MLAEIMDGKYTVDLRAILAIGRRVGEKTTYLQIDYIQNSTVLYAGEGTTEEGIREEQARVTALWKAEKEEFGIEEETRKKISEAQLKLQATLVNKMLTI